jgi:RNA polymerase-binding transcription factor DksA
MAGLSHAARLTFFDPSLVDDAQKGDRQDRASAQGIIATGIQIATITTNARRREQLEAIVHAALDKSQKGKCRECGDAISAARLEARPFATRCTRCEAEVNG